ncbi:hypothetical protein LWI29_027548 [Acer saccharum]|uniref:Seven-in-absentia protein TRAF-like domain-containing protein n=1 Tax=Acer saccharum TaxID=4024 RepID=A0AA39RTC5_ACESA|nr:hypothetical protein LWI29_027548 [Acer saccharum]
MALAPVYMAFLQFMGGDNEGKNYSYSLEVGGNWRKMIWQEVPRGIRDSHRKVHDRRYEIGIVDHCAVLLAFALSLLLNNTPVRALFFNLNNEFAEKVVKSHATCEKQKIQYSSADTSITSASKRPKIVSNL